MDWTDGYRDGTRAAAAAIRAATPLAAVTQPTVPQEGLDICPQCSGSGVGVADTVCARCNGSGGVPVIDLETLAYDELWQAIADATRVEGGVVAISVVKFREAIRRAALTGAGENGEQGA